MSSHSCFHGCDAGDAESSGLAGGAVGTSGGRPASAKPCNPCTLCKPDRDVKCPWCKHGLPPLDHKKLERSFLLALTDPEKDDDDAAYFDACNEWHRDVVIAERILTVLKIKFTPSLISNVCKATTLKEAEHDPDVQVLLEGHVK